MGALISIPLIPVQLAVAAGASAIGSCVSSALCGAVGSTFGFSTATRLVYAFAFLLNSILAWVTLSGWALDRLDFLRWACQGDQCRGFVAVHRITSSLGLTHFALAAALSIAQNQSLKLSYEIQNGWWRTKLFLWVSIFSLSFFLPAGFWLFWGNYVAPLGSFVFILIGLVLLVDFAHSWAETCVEHIEESDDDAKGWKIALIGSTLGGYVAAVVLSIVMYVFFASSGCSMNQAAITVNIIFGLIVSVLSIHPVVQEYNSRAGLAQGSMVVLYCTYLIASAVAAEPDDKNCNPLVRSRGTRTMSIVMGALFTFLAIAYTTTRAAYRSVELPDDENDAQASQRMEALKQAVAEGSLPASALTEAENANSANKDDYNYVVFHVIFLLATMYTATLLTMNVESDPVDNFMPVGRTYFAAWTKIVSSWLCYALYSWSLIAPVVMPDRF